MVLGTDDVNTQWRQVLALMHTDVIYAMSPQAKGKIERPYRWLQDRIVRASTIEHITTLAEARSIFREEVHRYRCPASPFHHPAEIPALRFEKAQNENRSLFSGLLPYPNRLPPPRISFAFIISALPMAIAESPLGEYSPADPRHRTQRRC